MEKIAKTIVGLKTLESKIDEKKLIKYVEFTVSHDNPGINIWKFVCAFLLLMLNIFGKSIKNEYE